MTRHRLNPRPSDGGARQELDPYDPAKYWTFVHSKRCEQRKAERGECSPAEAYDLDQSRAY